MITFKGNEHYPLGNASLNIVAGKLAISNIGSSGIDGVLIKTPTNGLDVRFNPFQITGSQVFRVCVKGLLADGTINTLSEKVYWRDSSNLLNIGYNMSLVPPNFDVVGYTGGVEVLRIPFNNRHYNPVPDPDPNPDPHPEPAGLIFAIIGAIATVATVAKIAYDVFSHKYTRTVETQLPSGQKVTTTEEWTDPPVETYNIGGTDYTCEIIGIEHKETQQPSSPTATYANYLIEMTTANTNSFEIEDEI